MGRTWWGSGVDSVGAAWDLARDAVLLGWAATAVFCAVAGAAIALWGGLRWWLGFVIGAVALYAGLLLLLLIAGLRVGERTRVVRADRRALAATPPRYPPYPPPPAGPSAAAIGSAPDAVPPRASGVRSQLRVGWRRWTRTPPTRSEKAVAVVAVLVAVGLVVATQVTWLKLTAVGYGVVGVGPFGVQLGLFVVLSALAALAVAVGLLRWRSAWWPVLLAWCATWWLFIAVEVRHAGGALDALNRLLRDQVRDRLGYDVRPTFVLGVGWSVMIGLAAAMLVLSVVLLVLQGRRNGQYRPVAPLSTSGGSGRPAAP